MALSATDVVLILASMLVSALCSGLEIAFVSSNKLYFELQRKQGSLAGRLIAGLLPRPARLIGTLLVGNNIALVVYGIAMARVLEPWFLEVLHSEPLVLVAQTAVSTLIILVFAEFLPKTLFRLDPNGTLSLFALPLRFLYVLLWLPMMLMTGVSELVLRLFGIRSRPGEVAFGRIDLNEFLKEATDNANDDEDLDAEVEYFRNTLELSSIKVREVMIPRAEIEAVSVEEPMTEVFKRFNESGLSKLLVYSGNVDNIIGYVHGKEMFRRPRSVRSVLRPVNHIPGTMPADQVLQLFSKQRGHVAVVVDEFGGTAGMVTMEDLVEVIVGDIEDEHDLGELVEEQVGEHEYLLSGRCEVDDLAERFRLAIPESEEYDTLAGFILHEQGEVPEQGSEVVIGPFRITVAQVVHGRVDLVRLAVTDAEMGYSA